MYKHRMLLEEVLLEYISGHMKKVVKIASTDLPRVSCVWPI